MGSSGVSVSLGLLCVLHCERVQLFAMALAALPST